MSKRHSIIRFAYLENLHKNKSQVSLPDLTPHFNSPTNFKDFDIYENCATIDKAEGIV